jgi:hypothetical protein
MRDLDKVTRLARETSRLAHQRQADEAHRRQIRLRNIASLSARLKVFAADLRGRVGVYVSTSQHETKVSISSMHPLLRKPFRVVAIHANDGEASYNVRVSLPEDSDYKPGDHLSLDEVADFLAFQAADFVNERDNIPFELPAWTLARGAIIGWLLFILTWLVLAAVFGAF